MCLGFEEKKMPHGKVERSWLGVMWGRGDFV